MLGSSGTVRERGQRQKHRGRAGLARRVEAAARVAHHCQLCRCPTASADAAAPSLLLLLFWPPRPRVALRRSKGRCRPIGSMGPSCPPRRNCHTVPRLRMARLTLTSVARAAPMATISLIDTLLSLLGCQRRPGPEECLQRSEAAVHGPVPTHVQTHPCAERGRPHPYSAHAPQLVLNQRHAKAKCRYVLSELLESFKLCLTGREVPNIMGTCRTRMNVVLATCRYTHPPARLPACECFALPPSHICFKSRSFNP